MVVCAVVGVAILVWCATLLPRGGSSTRASGATAPTVATRTVEPAAPAAPESSGARTTAPGSSGRSAAGVNQQAVADVPDDGSRAYVMAHVSVPTTATTGRLYRYDLHVEKDLDLDPDDVGRAIEKTLDDPRSWRYGGKVRLSLVAAGETADLHAYLVTPETTDRLCAPLLTRGEVSCNAGSKVVLNAKRWTFSSDAFGPDVARYREYLVNHEFGHALGHGHVICSTPGKPAPVMQQQTKFLKGCRANAWPSVTHG